MSNRSASVAGWQDDCGHLPAAALPRAGAPPRLPYIPFCSSLPNLRMVSEIKREREHFVSFLFLKLGHQMDWAIVYLYG